MQTSIKYSKSKKSSKTLTVFFLIFFVSVISTVLFLSLRSENKDDIEPTYSSNENEETYPDIEALNNVPNFNRKASLIAVGDFLLDRNVGRMMKEWNDYYYPIRNTKHILESADITFCNVECPICEGREIGYTERSFRADPETVQTLVYGGFDIVSLANNHTMNFGGDCLAKTFDYLDKANIEYVGAGLDYEDSHKPTIMKAQGINIAFLAYNDSDVVPSYYFSAENRVGTNLMDVDQLKKDIEKTRNGEFGEVDLIAVSMHSGTEYTPIPNQRQITFARSAIDFGADIILGHHPHHVQHIEQYKGKFIIYSMGNFVLDQMAYPDCTKELLLNITLNKDSIHEVEIIPIRMKKFCETNVAVGAEKQEILDIINYTTKTEPYIKYEESEFVLKKRDVLVDNSNDKRSQTSWNLNTKKSWKVNSEETLDLSFYQKRLYILQEDEIIWASNKDYEISDFETGTFNNKNYLLLSYWENGENKTSNLEIFQYQEDKVTSINKTDFRKSPILNLKTNNLDNKIGDEIILSIGNYEDYRKEYVEYDGVAVYKFENNNLFKLKSFEISYNDIWIIRDMIYLNE